MFSVSIIAYVLKAALFDRIFLSFLLLTAIGVSISIFMGSAASTEADQFSLVFAAGGLRVASVIGLVLFIVFYLRRSFDSKDIDYLLTRPISRVNFILSHAIAFIILASFFALMVTGVMAALGAYNAPEGYLLWAFSVWIELIIIANAAMFFAMVIPNAAAGTLCVFLLYLLSRLMGQFLGILDTGIELPAAQFIKILMEICSLIVPRLDLFGQTSWLLYGPDDASGYLLILLQGVVYSFLLIAAALVDFIRRQF